MVVMSQEFAPSAPAISTNMFPVAGLNIPKNSEFLKAFGNGSTNKQAAEAQPTAKPPRPGSAFGPNTEDNVFFDFEPQSNSPPADSAFNITTEDNVFFDFEPQSKHVSPFQKSFSTPSATSIPGWGTDMNFRPVSPPDSTTFSPEEDSFNPSSTNTPGNILTNIQLNGFRAQYGQVTPPDDDSDSLFEHQVREQQEQQPQIETEQSSSPSKRRKRTDTYAKDAATTTQAPTKRTRKYASRTSKSNPPDPNNPADVRRSKFLERNRVAASKCRQKKKEWTQNLESRARDLQKNNASLRIMVESLREEALFLKGECKKHVGCDCREIQHFMDDMAHKFHGTQLLIKKELVSPVGSAPRSRVGSIDYASRYGSEGPSATDVASDENVLEALLTSSIEQDTSEESIKSKASG
ncbi:MAG: hypothetical protein Q9217_006059 [Psora testacea]